MNSKNNIMTSDSKIPSSDLIIEDEYGNKIFITEGGQKISLKLHREVTKSEIGRINFEERYLEVNRSRYRDLFKTNNSYGFNHHIIKNAKKFDHVMLSDEFGKWLIPNQLILEKGRFLTSSNRGFELQIYLSIDLITNLCKDCTY